MDGYCWWLGDWVRWPVCPLDNLCDIISVMPMGKGHKKMLNTVKWQSWEFNQGLAALPKRGFHAA